MLGELSKLPMRSNAGQDVGRAKTRFPQRSERSTERSLLQSAPKIAEVNAGIVARLGIAHFPDQQEAVLSALSSNPLFQFWYLREVLAGKSVTGENDLLDTTACGENDDHQLLRRV